MWRPKFGSDLKELASSWESWLIRPPDTREIPSSSLGEDSVIGDLSKSFFLWTVLVFCPLREGFLWKPLIDYRIQIESPLTSMTLVFRFCYIHEHVLGPKYE